jgi:hypothetical protein
MNLMALSGANLFLRPKLFLLSFVLLMDDANENSFLYRALSFKFQGFRQRTKLQKFPLSSGNRRKDAALRSKLCQFSGQIKLVRELGNRAGADILHALQAAIPIPHVSPIA